MFDLPDYKKVEIAPPYLLIVILPLLVLTVSELLLSYFGHPTLALPESAQIVHDPIKEASARYQFLGAFLFYAVVGAILTAVFIGEVALRHTYKSMIYTAIAVALTLPIAMLFSSLEPETLKSFEAYQLIGGDFVRAALGDNNVPYCTLKGVECGEHDGFIAMTTLTGLTNNIAEIASTAVVFGMILALARPVPAPETPEGRVRALRYAQSVMRRYLYFAGLLLSAGLLMNMAWMSWPAEMIGNAEIRAEHAKLVQSISLYRGVSYSMLILSYYMPVSLILMLQIEILHDDAAEKASSSLADALKRFEVNRIKPLEAIKAILAITSPILAAGFGQAVTNFTLL